MTSDIAAPWASEAFATDSSEEAGAIVSAPATKELTRRLWTASSIAPSSARLLSKEKAALRRVDPMFKELPEDSPVVAKPTPKRPLGLRFHVLQVGRGFEPLLDALSAEGWKVGPVLALDRYDPTLPRLAEWII